MAVIINQVQRQNQIAVISNALPSLRIGNATFRLSDLNTSFSRFNTFWDLMDVVQRHGYLSAAMRTIGRSVISTGWSLRKHEEYGSEATEKQRKTLLSFYMYKQKRWDNIKDFQSFSYKLMIGAMYLRYFGQAAYQIIRNKSGVPLGFDFLPGYVHPNVDNAGSFLTPAFTQYPTNNPANKVDFESARDIIFIVNPDWQGYPSGGSDVEALSTYTLPLDLYLMGAAKSYMENRDRPEVVYSLPPDISAEGFDAFVKQMQANHAGASNLGKNPIAIQGDFNIKELKPLPDSLPYQESRLAARDEELATAGVSGAKLGLLDGVSNSNFREIRREFHETSLVPLLIMLEVGFYEQVHEREFYAPGWEFKFGNPDFLNAVERATVHMRYMQMGAYSANDVRYALGEPARTDPGGDAYVTLANNADPSAYPGNGGTAGSPPEGSNPDPDSPSNTGEPVMDSDPVRGDGHDEFQHSLTGFTTEVKTWKRFCVNRMSRGKALRPFRTEHIPDEIAQLIAAQLQSVKSVADVVSIFDAVLMEVENERDEN